MEIFFLVLLIVLMAAALGSGYPVAFALPGAAILSILLAAGAGWIFEQNPDAYFHTGGPSQWLSAGVTNLRGVYWDVDRDTLIAIPLFIFMGIMLQRSKIAEDLLVMMAKLFGPVPGGLGISVMFVGALLAATTGIVGATVVAMGLISLPAMMRVGYSTPLATGAIAASGTLGQIIPPSIVLIILADQLGSATDQASTLRKELHKDATGELSMPSGFDISSTSAGELFLGALVPGLMLVGLYMIFILIYALIFPKRAPAVRSDAPFNAAFIGDVALTLIPPLGLIFLVLGSILTGVATVNQAGAVGAVGALVMASYRLFPGRGFMTFAPALIAIAGVAIIAWTVSTYEMNIKAADSPEDWEGIRIGLVGAAFVLFAVVWSSVRVYGFENTLTGVMVETAKSTSLVFIILLGAAILTSAFRAFGGEELVRDFLLSLPGGFWSQFVIVMAVIFFLGFFIDFIEIAVVVVPIVAPILLADPGANITAVWLGVMIGVNVQTSFLTPPFGFALFYLRGVAPASVKTTQIYRGVIAFIMLQLLALFITGIFPPLANYLPQRSSLLAETAPPPRNPRLQVCLAEIVRDRMATDGAATLAAISAAKSLDLSALPRDLAAKVTGGVAAAETALAALERSFVAGEAVAEAAPAYRPFLKEVRRVERLVREETEKIERLTTRLERLRGDDTAVEKAEIEAEIALLDADRARLAALIPAEWDAKHDAFAALTKAEETARAEWQRNADKAFDEPAEVAAILAATPAFAALEADLAALGETIARGTDAEAEALEAAVKAMEDRLGAVAGASPVATELAKARRALRARSFDIPKAVAAHAAAVEAYREQAAWRAAATPLAPGLAAWLEGIAATVGVRSQPRIDRDTALALASCTAAHRDLSLNF